ncbi:MAG TPA: HU family DNA-binding protein [Dongiaceae bacterium]|nr:HU family DNA-binding protein [Dongiaceae bacterium]
MPAKKKAAAKPAAKKPAAKKAPAKKAPAKKAAAPKAAAAPKKVTTATEAFTKSQIVTTIADSTQLSRKQVQGVFDELSSLIEAHLKKKGAGQFTIPGLLKLKVIDKPATKARKGINPFTGEETTFKAKPASRKVKAVALAKLKGFVNS